MKKLKIIFILLFLITIFACSKKSQDSPISNNGQHMDEWLAKNHTYKNSGQNPTFSILSCTECHGNDYKGGISNISCSSSNCHLENVAHPLPWIYNGHKIMAQKETNSCAKCHGADYKGGESGVSCYTCHEGPGANKHNEAWLHQHAAEVKIENISCISCHGENYKGGISQISCYSCHLSGEKGYPHPFEWGTDSSSIFLAHQDSDYSDTNNICAFSYCHGAILQGGEATISWGKAPSCYLESLNDKSCHLSIPD